MCLNGIVNYTLRAAVFAAVVCVIYALVQKLRGKPIRFERLLFVFYFAALIGITVVRGTSVFNSLFIIEHPTVQWVPFATTQNQLQSGLWPMIYHVGGNIAWFLPLGFFLRRKHIWAAALAGLLLSIIIECLQWALITGMPDVDDVLYNTCGAMVGWAAGTIVQKYISRHSGTSVKA